jgi:hypothetical protein
MKQNVGRADRIIRLILGIAIIGFGIVFRSLWGLVGLIPLLTGILGRCGLYLPFHINTAKAAGAKEPGAKV